MNSFSNKLNFIFIASIMILSGVPQANAANNLNVAAITNVYAYYSASSALPVGSKLSSVMAKSAINKFCTRYNFLGITGASGRKLAMNKILHTGKISNARWLQNSDGEDEYVFKVTCNYKTVFNKLPNSNWYVVDFIQYKDEYGPIQSHRILLKDLQTSKWKVNLSIGTNGVQRWLPEFKFQTPNLKSQGCISFSEQIRSRIQLNDPLYLEAPFAPGPKEIKYFKYLSSTTNEIPNYPSDPNVPDGFEGWDTMVNDQFDFIKETEDSRFSKVAFIYETSAEVEDIYTISLEMGSDCQILKIINLGKTK